MPQAAARLLHTLQAQIIGSQSSEDKVELSLAALFFHRDASLYCTN
jgi:hypothetical protein